VWIITISILSFDILFQGYFGKNIIGYETSNPFRNSSFFFDELKAAALLVGFTFLSLSIFINNSSKEKIIYLIFIICLACLVTGERANFIRYFLLFLGFIFICRKKYNLLNILIITSIALIPLITIYKNDIIERNARSLHWLENGEHDLNFKKKYLKSHYGIHAITAYEIFQDNIFIGVGNKNFRNICKNYQDKISNKYNVQPIGCSTHPHQIWYELLTEHGIFGTLLICICLILIIINRFKERNINLINLMSLLYLLSVFIPILPSGSFFNSYNSTMFWTNLAFFVISFRKS